MNSSLICALLLAVTTVVLTTPSASAGDLEKANALYEKGRCRSAVLIYERILSNPKAKDKTTAEAQFRKAYCEYTLGRYVEAEESFRDFLAHDPTHVEARLRLAESLVFQQDYEAALDEMKRIRLPDNQRWLVWYWQGVSRYMISDPISAEANFHEAINDAPAGSWVRKESDDWLKRLKTEQRWFQPSASISAFWDGNATYSPTPTPSMAYLPALNVNFLLKRGKRWQLFFPVGLSSTFFKEDIAKDYEFQVVSGGLDFLYTVSPKLTTGFSASFIDTRRRFRYNQDFIFISPSVSYKIGSRVNLSFNPSLTRNVTTNPAWTISPGATVSWRDSAWTASFGTTYGQSFAEKATVDPTVFRAAAGRVSSQYKSLGLQASISRWLPFELAASAQVSTTRTWFEAEEAFAAFPRRMDNTYGVSFSLSREAVTQGLSTTLTLASTRNLSQGLQIVQDDQGVLYDYDYNYVKPVISLSVGYSF